MTAPLFVLPPVIARMVLQTEGLNQPGKWPGGQSGITIGRGYDLGHCTREQFLSDWKSFIPRTLLERLTHAIGVRGAAAHKTASLYRDIYISRDAADAVFLSRSVPHYWGLTCQAFPGVEVLPPNAQGALWSLVYNRGVSMVGPHRKEMRAVREAVKAKDLPEIARQLRLMKRLWVGKGLDGLIARREEEARLVERA